jgi:non-heme chloroperoxidase
MMRAKPELRKLNLNGTELHYQEAGKGDPLVLVHGTVADYRTWRRQLAEFAKHYHVISYSRRFHFPNAANERDEYSVQLHAEDLAQLIQHFSEKPAHIVSASWGGNVALYVALKHPDLVHSIVLGEPPTLPLLMNDARQKYLADDFYLHSFLPAREALLKNRWEDGVRLFVDGVMGQGSFNAMPSPIQKYFLDNAAEFKAEAVSENYFFNFTSDIVSTIHTPTLLLEGDRSPKFFHVILDILQSSLSNVERRIIPNASHGIHIDNTKVYNEVVLNFLNNIETRDLPQRNNVA